MPFQLTISDSKVRKTKMEVNFRRLATNTGYSVSHISRIFARKTTPSLVCLERIAEALGYDITTLRDLIKDRRIYAAKTH
jgi:transcriptional regulator with XRE-family HTH domain